MRIPCFANDSLTVKTFLGSFASWALLEAVEGVFEGVVARMAEVEVEVEAEVEEGIGGLRYVETFLRLEVSVKGMDVEVAMIDTSAFLPPSSPSLVKLFPSRRP